MALSALVSLGGADQSSGVLVAYVGTEVRGVQDTVSTPPFGAYAGKALFQITMYAENGGETLSFQFYTGSTTVSLSETVTFEVNGNVGSVVAPFLLTGTLAVSSPPPPSPPPPVPSPPPTGVSVSPPPPSPPPPTPSPPPGTVVSASPPPPSPPPPAPSPPPVVSPPAASPPPFLFDPAAYANTMALSALVSLGGVDQSSGVLVAYVGTEVRGVQDTVSTPPFGAYAGKALFQITMYAENGGETMNFQFYTGSTTVSLSETVTFEVNGNVGSVVAPFLLTGTLAVSSPPPPSPPPPVPSPPPTGVSVSPPPPSPPPPTPSPPPGTVVSASRPSSSPPPPSPPPPLPSPPPSVVSSPPPPPVPSLPPSPSPPPSPPPPSTPPSSPPPSPPPPSPPPPSPPPPSPPPPLAPPPSLPPPSSQPSLSPPPPST